MPSADGTMDGGSPARRASSSLATSKIAYLCVKPTTADDLKSKDELKTALQHAGIELRLLNVAEPKALPLQVTIQLTPCSKSIGVN